MPSPQRITPQSSESSSREQALLLTKHSYEHMIRSLCMIRPGGC